MRRLTRRLGCYCECANWPRSNDDLGARRSPAVYERRRLVDDASTLSPTASRIASHASGDSLAQGANLAVVAPALELTVSVEVAPTGGDEVHVHVGGQGFWVARMARTLGARVRLCTVLGGEAGTVVAGLIRTAGIELEAVQCDATTVASLHDNRSDERKTVARTSPVPLGRHEVDELFGIAIAAGVDADMVLLTGSSEPSQIPSDFYRRLASDLRTNGARVGADLSGDALTSALKGGIDFLKVADGELGEAGFASGEDENAIRAGLRRVADAGAENILVSRGNDAALAVVDDHELQLRFPRLEPIEPRGAGDSIFAGISAMRAAGKPWHTCLAIGIAAGSLNVTRRGLGSGRREDIKSIAERVELVELD